MYKPALSSMRNQFIIMLFCIFSLFSCTSGKEVKQEKAEIAVLMSLSGPSGDQGKKIAELIKFGIEDNLKGFVNITTYDVATEDYAAQAEEKISRNGTNIILGPLFSVSVKSFNKVVTNKNMIMITLSNNPGVADENKVFVFGHTPLKQTNMLLSYFLSKNYKDFILLIPETRGALQLKKVYSDILSANGASLIDTQEYVDSKESIEKALTKIASKVDEKMEDVDAENRPVILISEDRPEILTQIFDEVKKHNIDNKAIVAGDSRIDIQYPKGINLTLTGSLHIASSALIEKAKTSLNIDHLNYLENLAYDLGSFASIAVGISYSKETFLNRLRAPIWNEGLSGSFRFQSGVVERKYSIIERTGNVYKVVE